MSAIAPRLHNILLHNAYEFEQQIECHSPCVRFIIIDNNLLHYCDFDVSAIIKCKRI